MQGYDDLSGSTPEEREDIIKRWRHLQKGLKKKKNPAEERLDAVHDYFDAKREKRRMTKDKGKAQQTPEATVTANHSEVTSPRGLTHAQTFPLDHSQEHLAHEAEIEQAIRASVARNSHGNPEQDHLIEQAIRASMAELQRIQSDDADHEEALHKAMQASIAEARHHAHGEVDANELESALRNSIFEARRQHLEDSGVDTEDDEDVKRVMEESKQTAGRPESGTTDAAHDEELRKAIEESSRAHTQKEQDEERAKMEEQIVMEYVRKQSMKEADYRKTLPPDKEAEVKGEDSADELERAMKMSLEHGGSGEASGGGLPP